MARTQHVRQSYGQSDNLGCPTITRGRQKWLRDELKIRFNIQINAESVSKWFNAETLPRPSLIKPIIDVLGVNESRLLAGVPPMKGKGADGSFGADRHSSADAPAQPSASGKSQIYLGAVDLVAAIVQLGGGTVAFPGPRESGAMFVLLNGISHVVQVLLANEIGTNLYSIIAPHGIEATAVVAVMPGHHAFDARFISSMTPFGP